jgi:hypothetical protein
LPDLPGLLRGKQAKALAVLAPDDVALLEIDLVGAQFRGQFRDGRDLVKVDRHHDEVDHGFDRFAGAHPAESPEIFTDPLKI